MKIGYIERCDFLPEREAFLRFKKAFEMQGDEFYFMDLHGYVSTPKKCYADDLNLDFCIVTDYTDLWQRQLPDCPCLFLKWVPSGYLPFWYNKGFFYKMVNFDFCLTNCTTDDATNVLHMCGDPKIFFYPQYYLVASPSQSNCLAPVKYKKLKLFYIGTNAEKRFYNLFNKLDQTNEVEFYGFPSSWEGYKNYKRQIPSDGSSLLKQLNQTGICLALISKEHYQTGHITSRLWEGLAAGAVCITPEDKKIKKDFGDNLYYIDINLPEDELYQKIMQIVHEINSDRNKSYLKAVKAQEIFKEKYSAEKMVLQLKEAFAQFKKDLEKEGEERIDIIAYVDSQDVFQRIFKNIEKQTYNNKFVHFITDKKEFINEDCLKNIAYHIYEQDTTNRGYSFNKIRDKILGKAFVFIDGNTYWQFRFLYKMKRILDERNLDFTYSGTFYKRYDKWGKVEKFDYLLTEETEKEEFLSPLHNQYFREEEYLFFEEKFSLGCSIFSSCVLKNCDGIRLSFFHNSPHIYLAVKSLLQNLKSGDFARIYCSGYECFYNDYQNKAKHSDEFYQSCGRPGKLTSVAILCSFVSELRLKDNININPELIKEPVDENLVHLYTYQQTKLLLSYLKLKIIFLKLKKMLSFKKSQKIKKRIKELKEITRLLKKKLKGEIACI